MVRALTARPAPDRVRAAAGCPMLGATAAKGATEPGA